MESEVTALAVSAPVRMPEELKIAIIFPLGISLLSLCPAVGAWPSERFTVKLIAQYETVTSP